MPRVTRRAAARADLAEIWDYIAQDDPKRATAFLREIEAVFETLASQPMIGRERLELGEAIRSFPIGRYVVYYQPWSDGVDVVRVLHAARDVARLTG